ncbi:MAG: sulfite reductase subunit alpha [Rubripirellula sp.]
MSSFIPDTAPFSEEQRAWLNGFFSGLMGIQPGASAGAMLEAAGISTDAIPGIAEAEEEEDQPWHDSALPIVERMDLAEGKPLERKLMAAMAQLDCGSCGYICQSYGEAIASGEETNLTLCSPGGKETKQMIKQLVKDQQPQAQSGSNGKDVTATSAWSRKNPFTAKLVESRSLNGEGSAKDTRHVAIDLNGSGLKYEVGDALGVCPTNCSELAVQVIDRIVADSDLAVDTPLGSRKPLLQALMEDCCLKDPSDDLVELLSNRTGCGDAKVELSRMIEEGVHDGIDVLELLELAGDAPLTATEFIGTLEPLNPRLYSIASSMKQVGAEVHLTVGKVTFDREGRQRKGVASTMLADRVTAGEDVRVFVQPNHGGFTTPDDHDTPMIMVGPGTGIAPFVAFLQERDQASAPGSNWLFFGDQHEATDFLYRDQLTEYVDRGVLDRLDTAFSRDGDAKVYVQDRMRERAADLWGWLQKGAHFYVCGDASRMANDVHLALLEIIGEEGKMNMADSERYVSEMATSGRYVRDVY